MVDRIEVTHEFKISFPVWVCTRVVQARDPADESITISTEIFAHQSAILDAPGICADFAHLANQLQH